MKPAIFLTLILSIIHFSPALAQNSQQRARVYVGDSDCCGQGALYNNGSSGKAAAPLNLKSMLKSNSGNRMKYRYIGSREKSTTYNFGAKYDSDRKDNKLRELSSLTERKEYENALQRATARKAADRKRRAELQKRIQYYKQQSELYDQKYAIKQKGINKQNEDRQNSYSGSSKKVRYVTNPGNGDEPDTPKRLFLTHN